MKCFKHARKDAIGSCSSCGKGVCADCGVVVEEKLFCKDCLSKGTAKKSQQPAERKNPVLALILSGVGAFFLLPGLGQIYNGEVGKGIILIVVYFISAMATLVLIGICTTPLIWLYGMYDAYHTANQINKGEKNV